MKPRIVILASGGGTTAEAFIRAGASGEIAAEVGLIIASRSDAGVLDRIANLNRELNVSIPVEVINHKTHPASSGEIVQPGCQTKAEEQAIIDRISSGDFALVALMGYMKRIGPNMVERFGWHGGLTNRWQAMMLNTHPGLLPETIGKYGVHVQELVLEAGLPQAGQTLHIVSENYDEGPKIAEHRLAVQADETAEALFDRVQLIEKQFLPVDIDTFIRERQQYLSGDHKEA